MPEDGKTRYEVHYRARVTAPAKRVYDILADYHNGHSRILPAAFREFVVEQGGPEELEVDEDDKVRSSCRTF